MSENLLLVHQVSGKVNGANVHRATALIRGYQSLLDVANDSRCNRRARLAARREVMRAEQELRNFCEAQ